MNIIMILEIRHRHNLQQMVGQLMNEQLTLIVMEYMVAVEL